MELTPPPELALAEEPFDVEVLADGEHLPESIERWEVIDTRSAEWSMRHVARARDLMLEAQATAAEWHRRIDLWLEAELARPARTVGFFEHHLEQYALAQRAEHPEVKHVRLPSGMVQTTAKSPRIVIEDRAVVAEWAKTLGKVEDQLAVLPPCEPQVSLSGLQKLAEVVEVVEAARITVSPCGHYAPWWHPSALEGEPAWVWLNLDGLLFDVLPGAGDGVRCPLCNEDALVGRVDVLAVRHEARYCGKVVPGTSVTAASVEAKVKW